MVSTVLTGGDGGAGAIGDTNLTLVTFTELITKTGALKGLRVHGSGAGDQIDADDYKFLDFVLTQDQRANFMRIMSIEEISTAHGTLNTARTSKLDKKINVYSFALKPEEHQPSGTCNFSRIDSATLEFGSSPTGSNGHIYAVNYNVLRIMSGMGGLAYSN